MSGKRAKRRRKAAKELTGTGQMIRLQNPVADFYATWIYGNAQTPDVQVVQQDGAKGQHIVICGAGPSLAEHAAEWCPQADQVWGCNSALTYLHGNGHKVTHGFCIDQTADMLQEWQHAPPVEYLLASTVHPHLTEYLASQGHPVHFFHNYVGVQPALCLACKTCLALQPPDTKACPDCGGEVGVAEYEEILYQSLYAPTVRAGSGLNSVTRAIDVALFVGAETITVLGADCALRVSRPLADGAVAGSPEYMAWLRDDVVMHADGGHALTSGATAMTVSGEIDGRLWLTKPDMVITAVWLRKMAKVLPQVHLIGDTLPNAIMDKPESFIARLPCLVGSDGKPIRFFEEAGA